MTNEDHELFADSVRRALAQNGPVDDHLADIGWADALEEWGGPAISIVFEALGEACATGSALDDVIARMIGVECPAVVVLPLLGRTTAPGTLTGDTVEVAGVARTRITAAERAIVVAADQDGYQGAHRAIVVPTAELNLTAINGLDPDAGLSAVSASVARSAAVQELPADWQQLAAVARVALAGELVGSSRAMLNLAAEHARSRIQFGKPIASFQAVRHRLADAYLAIEAAHAAAVACTDAIGPDCAASDLPAAHALMAKALAGSSARAAARHCQQVLAGVGFTAEHRFHHYFRRVLVLDRLMGSAKELTREVGSIAIAEQRAPFSLPL